MSLNCGIVGLPNVGKSTIFSALTSNQVKASNYPFCTIEPNISIVNVPDQRLDKIYQVFKPKEKIYTSIEFVDIAGLVKGASHGEGLGNKFLSNIREVDAIIHVVRCFEDKDIAHTSKQINPVEDIETVNIELALSDIDTIERRFEKLEKKMKHTDRKIVALAEEERDLLVKIKNELGKGIPARKMALSSDQLNIIRDLDLLTLKKVLYLCNIDEKDLEEPEKSKYVQQVRKFCDEEKAKLVTISGKIENELNQMEEDERKEYRQMLGINESGLENLIKKAYSLLNLYTFFTKNEKETRAWTIRKGTKAPQAAGKIHTDFEKGFIKAHVYNYQDLIQFLDEEEIKKHGKMRTEGKDYVVQDGDIILFMFAK